MSASIHVFLQTSRLPTVDEWNVAIRAEGFDLTLDPFDLRTDDCYRPAILKGEEAGFEWFLAPNRRLEEEPESPDWVQVRDQDLEASLQFSTNDAEYVTTFIAAAVLAKMTDGVLLHIESNSFMRGDAAISAARARFMKWQAGPQSPGNPNTAATPPSAEKPEKKGGIWGWFRRP